jgi:hypothetical protein
MLGTTLVGLVEDACDFAMPDTLCHVTTSETSVAAVDDSVTFFESEFAFVSHGVIPKKKPHLDVVG